MDLSSLPTARELASLAPDRVSHWRPGLGGARHSELFCSSRDGGGAAVALALALDGLTLDGLTLDGMREAGSDRLEERSILWVQDGASVRLTGKPYRPGLPAGLRHRVIHVVAPRPEDALFALEEGVRCRDLAFVIGEVTGNPKALDFTASRRLSLTAERHDVPLFLIRHDASPDLSSARMRWRIRSAPSLIPRWNSQAPGRPGWHAELFRARLYIPGEWTLRDDGYGLALIKEAARRPDNQGNGPGSDQTAEAPNHGDLAGKAGDRSLEAS